MSSPLIHSPWGKKWKRTGSNNHFLFTLGLTFRNFKILIYLNIVINNVVVFIYRKWLLWSFQRQYRIFTGHTQLKEENDMKRKSSELKRKEEILKQRKIKEKKQAYQKHRQKQRQGRRNFKSQMSRKKRWCSLFILLPSLFWILLLKCWKHTKKVLLTSKQLLYNLNWDIN